MSTNVKTIAIKVIIDVVGALASETMANNIYFLDDNKAHGSTGEGTEQLRTKVQKGDKLVWMVVALECEAYASIDGILIDNDYCDIKEETYSGSDVTYWVGEVKQDLHELPYHMTFKVGSRKQSMITANTPFLIGNMTA